MAEIHYVKGDATRPEKTCLGGKLIVHVCNNERKWGSGFVVALSKRWSEPEDTYRCSDMVLGECSLAVVNEEVAVLNMIAQMGIRTVANKHGTSPIRYDALRGCLRRARGIALSTGASVHAPRIGAGRAGGDWGMIETILMDELVDHGIHVYVYDLPGNNDRYAFRVKRG